MGSGAKEKEEGKREGVQEGEKKCGNMMDSGQWILVGVSILHDSSDYKFKEGGETLVQNCIPAEYQAEPYCCIGYHVANKVCPAKNTAAPRLTVKYSPAP